MSPSESRESLLSLQDSDDPSVQPLPNKELVVQLRVHDSRPSTISKNFFLLQYVGVSFSLTWTTFNDISNTRNERYNAQWEVQGTSIADCV
jgi:hypothetical protein